MLDINEMGKKKRGEGQRVGGDKERERERERERRRRRRNKNSKVQSTLEYTVYTHFLHLSTVRLLLAVPNKIQHYDF